MIRLFVLLLTLSLTFGTSKAQKNSNIRIIQNEVLKDKIAGGWAGKMIGVTYGAPTEFKATGKTFEDSIKWKPSSVIGAKWQDDLYVQLTFLMTMDQYGVDAPAKKFQELFAKSGYMLWHANVQARKNYFDSIFPPKSGHPDYNIHADDIDFQIEADYIGFMCPGMPQTVGKISDKIGHIMNYGDGVYGGIFVGALYSAAFFESDLKKLIEHGLLSIPAESDYAKMIRDVLILHDHYPTDWRAAWKELEDKWGSDHICAAGGSFNIDAKLNGAYIVMGLLYGEGDPAKTLEISTRCGQDSDCNPSNALAVLGVIKGFKGLPASYREAVQSMGDTLFINTNYSFNKAVEQSFQYARKLAVQNGGKSTSTELQIRIQTPKASQLEVSFPKLVFDHSLSVFEEGGWQFKGDWKTYNRAGQSSLAKGKGLSKVSSKAGDEATVTFEGTGVSIVGNWYKDCGKADIFVDGKFARTIDGFFWYAQQSHEGMDLFHITNLPQGKHTVKVVVKGEKRAEATAANIYLNHAIVFKTAEKKSVNFKFSFQNYDALWSDPSVEKRISEGIKTNRMGLATLQFVDSKGKKLQNVEVKLEQTRHDFLFGANLFMLGGFPTPEENQKYETTFLSLFNYATVPFYWSDLEPEQGKPRYEKNSAPIYRRPPPDTVVEFCQKNNLEMKGHPLVWHQWYPKWRPENPEEAMKLAEQRIKSIANRYHETINRWEVVNEPVERPLWAVKWFNLPGDYLYRSFVSAAKEFPKENRMMINEASTYSWLKFEGDSCLYYKMIRGLLDKGARIDEIGMQLHIFNEKAWQSVLNGETYTPSQLFRVLDKYNDFGRPIGITELTIPTLPNSPAGEKTQAEVTKNWYRLWFSHPAVNAITWWNIVDATAAPGEDKTNAGMIRRDFSDKLSAKVLRDLIKRDWWTKITQNSGTKPAIDFKGFYGDYQVTAT